MLINLKQNNAYEENYNRRTNVVKLEVRKSIVANV